MHSPLNPLDASDSRNWHPGASPVPISAHRPNEATVSHASVSDAVSTDDSSKQKTSDERAWDRFALLEKMLVWGAEFAKLDMRAALELADQIVAAREPRFIITANLNYLMLCDQFPKLAEVNAAATAIIADGHPIVVRSRFASDPLPCRVAGSDMIVELAELSARRGYRLFLLGGADGVGDAAARELARRFPNLQIAGTYSPPYRELDANEQDALLARIRDAGTDVLLVAFGQPKGEFWIYENYKKLGVPLSIQIGASLDFLAGTARRAPKCWQRFGCEWLYRAFSDPRRLAPRYGQNILFLAKCLFTDVTRGWKRC